MVFRFPTKPTLHSLDSVHYQQTVMMTGCGSVLWMAPEILLGEKYNEKVDVFSYGMCLVELVHRNLPWHGSGVAQQQIPMRLTQGKRPEHQIRKAYPIKELIEERRLKRAAIAAKHAAAQKGGPAADSDRQRSEAAAAAAFVTAAFSSGVAAASNVRPADLR